MKKLTIIQEADTIDIIVEGEPMRTWEIAGMIYQAELMCRLKMIDQAGRPAGPAAADPPAGTMTAQTPEPDRGCTHGDQHVCSRCTPIGELFRPKPHRHKRPIEPDTTGEAETAVKGTAKLKTESNGEIDQKS